MENLNINVNIGRSLVLDSHYQKSGENVSMGLEDSLLSHLSLVSSRRDLCPGVASG